MGNQTVGKMFELREREKFDVMNKQTFSGEAGFPLGVPIDEYKPSIMAKWIKKNSVRFYAVLCKKKHTIEN